MKKLQRIFERVYTNKKKNWIIAERKIQLVELARVNPND